MKYNDYDKIYRRYGELGFPYPERVYFDRLSTEFNYNTKENKLLDIGYLLWHNYDVKGDIFNTFSDAHPSVNENTVRHTLMLLLKELYNISRVSGRWEMNTLSTLNLIDEFLYQVSKFYHLPYNQYHYHYLKDPKQMTEQELKDCNPWKEIADNYDLRNMLFSPYEDQVCTADKEMIDKFNEDTDPPYRYHLNVPVYPWYGNPLTANVIVLSLNPGYVERESVIAKVLQVLPLGLLEGYTLHLRSMLTFDCHSLLPHNGGKGNNVDYQDIANIHNSWYWKDRLEKGFVNEATGLTFDDVNRKFAVIQYIGYSSEKYKPFKNNALLPSQHYTRQLIQYIVANNPKTIFIVPRNVKMWQHFLGDIWDNERFIVSPDYLGQRFTKSILKQDYPKVINAFKQ